MTLALTNITLTLGDGDQQVVALDDVSLSVQPGELVAVVGPSGSGKSSLLAVAGLLVRPSAGQVTVNGVDVGDLPDKKRSDHRAEQIGFVFQAANLVPSLTVREQLLLIEHLNGRKPRRAEARADALLDSVGLADRVGHRPGQLSGGERQRAGIARALMNEPAILLADEPTSALDHARGRAVVELLAKQAHERAVAILMVTHDTSMLDVADRVLEMHDGRLVPTTVAA